MTAKEVLDKWLKAYRKQNYNAMYSHSQKTWRVNHGKGELKTKFAEPIEDYEILNVWKDYGNLQRIEARIKVSGRWNPVAMVNVVREKAPYKPAENGEWGVNPISAIKLNADVTAVDSAL